VYGRERAGSGAGDSRRGRDWDRDRERWGGEGEREGEGVSYGRFAWCAVAWQIWTETMKQRADLVCEGVEVRERTQVGDDGGSHLGVSAPMGSAVGIQE
jgi:hypothetical protein